MGFLFSVFLFPLLAGFIVSLGPPWLKYHTLRQNGYFLLLQCTLIGIFLFIASDLIVKELHEFFSDAEPASFTVCSINFLEIANEICKWIWDKFAIPLRSINDGVESKDVVKITDGAIAALIFALSIYILSGAFEYFLRVFRKNSIFSVWKGVLEREGSLLEKIISQAQTLDKPILITLKSRKVYIGYVADFPKKSAGARQDVMIMLLASGYRKASDMSLQLKNDYESIARIVIHYNQRKKEKKPFRALKLKLGENTIFINYEKAKYLSDHFGVSFSIDDIESVSFWIPDLQDYNS